MKIRSRPYLHVGGLVASTKTFFPGLDAFTIRPGNTSITTSGVVNDDRSHTYTLTISMTIDSDQVQVRRTIADLLKDIT